MFYNDSDFVNPYYAGGTLDGGPTGTFYGIGYYGADEFGYGWGGPVNLNSYQNNPDTIVLYWSIKPYAITIHDMEWVVETDTVYTFDSTDLRTFTSHTGGTPTEEFISGCVHKGISVPIYDRLQSEGKTMYWRVKGVLGSDESTWSTSNFVIPGAIDQDAREFKLSFLPDVLFNKLEGSNIYALHNATALEFEELNKVVTLVNNDNYAIAVRDESIVKNFGDLIGVVKPYEMANIDFREIIKNFMFNIRKAPSEKSVSALIHFIYGSFPEFTDVDSIATMYLEDTNPLTPVDGFYSYDHGDDAPIIWDDRHIAYGAVLDIQNKFGAECNNIITKEFVLRLVRKMCQAHTPVYLNYI